MKLYVNKTRLRLNPDLRKVIARFFNTGIERSALLIQKVLQMPDEQASSLLQEICVEFHARYRDIESIFEKHFAMVEHLLPENGILTLSQSKKLLIGSYFTMEYALEAAALFNPSIVEDPDQSGADDGELNVIISFRATGESHISSLVFKQGKLDRNASIRLEPSGSFVEEGTITEQQSPIGSYDVEFPAASLLSERVIFPVTILEKNGIEDARFVKFIKDDGNSTYIATYTAYNGLTIHPHVMETDDFRHFRISRLNGKAAINKNLALFPRKINGQYVMLARIDGVNNYIMYSEDLYEWETATLLQGPVHPWEFVQIGNGGSPIETERGWLLITHGVGPMRKYCLGATLLDVNDPSKVIGRLKEPLLMPDEHERDGYVPNVVYSCGAIIHQGKLFIPYALSDHASSFATIPLNELLNELTDNC